MRRLNKAGFTIIELLIATVVFSVVVLLITGAIIQIGRTYTKGETMSRTQEAARRVIDDVEQAIIFSPAEPVFDVPNHRLCVGDKEYNYAKGQQVNDTGWGLIVSDSNACPALAVIIPGSATPANFEEMLGERMRLSNFSVTQISPGTYKIKVRVVSGDSDLVCIDPLPSSSPPANASCDITDPMQPSDITGKDNLRCKNSSAGNEFCAMSELTTTVERRLN